MSPRPVPPPRPARDDKAARILAAATAVFSRYGFRRASLDDVARAAEVAKGTLYLYYDSKEALFRAVARDFAERVVAGAAAAVASPAPLPRRVTAVLEAKFLYVFDRVTRSAHAAELLDSKGRLASAVFASADRRYEALLARLLAEGEASGQLALGAVGLTPQSASAFLVRAGHGLATPGPGGRLPTRAAYRQRIAELVRVVMAASAARSASISAK